MQTHELKCYPAYFDAVERGEKTFEVRRDDRGYQKGDIIILRRYDPKNDYYALATRLPSLSKKIAYVLTGGQFGIEPGHVVMALEPAD